VSFSSVRFRIIVHAISYFIQTIFLTGKKCLLLFASFPLDHLSPKKAIRFQMVLLLLVLILLHCIIHTLCKQSLFTSLGFWAYAHDLVIKENTKSLSSLVCTSHYDVIPNKWHIVPNDQLDLGHNLSRKKHSKDRNRLKVEQFRSFNEYVQEIKHALTLQCECYYDKFLPVLKT